MDTLQQCYQDFRCVIIYSGKILFIMNKSEYRKLFIGILKNKDKRIRIDPLLKENGISPGNFYRFLKYDDKRGDRALSEEKCAILYNAVTNNGILPTNRVWMESLSNKDLAKEIKKRFAKDNPDISAKEIEQWLIDTRNK